MPADAATLDCPFVVVVDTREQASFSFADLRSDAREGSRPLNVPTVVGTLRSGDYSIRGLEDAVAVERKSMQDLYSTLGQGRERFVRELERLAVMEFAAVVVEADWSAMLSTPPPHSSLNPKTVFRSVLAWQQRYPRVHWWPCPNRRFAEITTFRILERFWKERQK